jgi:hypothetical protein
MGTLNYRFRNILPPVARALMVPVAFSLLVIPLTARAQFAGTAFGAVQYEQNSNVFSLDSEVPKPGEANRRGGDSFVAYQGGFNVNYFVDSQQLYATASISEFNYQRFTELDHTDYNIDTGLKWVLGHLLDGKLDVARSHTMVQFFDLNETTLSVNTTQRETAQIGVKLPSEWRLEGTVDTSTVNQPLPAQPDLQSKENSGTVAAKYLGISGFTIGFNAGYASGEFQGTNGIGIGDPSYRQTTEGVVASYLSGRSTWDGQLGYTRRTSADGTNDTSGVTGAISVMDQLTPKTSVQVKLSRALNSYVTNASTEVDSTAAVNWQATYKLNANLGYTFTYRKYPGQGNDPLGSDRRDIQEYATLGVSYQPRRWLVIRPYANIQTRSSDYFGGAFNQTIYGLYFTVLTPAKPKGR